MGQYVISQTAALNTGIYSWHASSLDRDISKDSNFCIHLYETRSAIGIRRHTLQSTITWNPTSNDPTKCTRLCAASQLHTINACALVRSTLCLHGSRHMHQTTLPRLGFTQTTIGYCPDGWTKLIMNTCTYRAGICTQGLVRGRV